MVADLSYAGLRESDEVMGAAIREALRALAGGQLVVPIDSILPLDQASDAFDRIRQRSVRGKLLLGTGNVSG